MDNPAFCKKGSDHPSAKVFPLERSSRQVAMLDPKTMKYTFVDTCFGTHHPQFGYDANDTLWLSGTGPVAGWVNTKMFDETGDAAKSQGWSPFVLDTNGNGKRDELRRAQPAGRSGQGQAHRARLRALCGDAEPGGRLDLVHGRRVRRHAGVLALRSRNADCRKSINVPLPGFGIRGGDIDKNGVVWASLASGHLGELRPAQVQGSAQRTERDRRSLPGGLVVLPVSGPGLRRHRREQRRVRATTPGSISTTRSGSAKTSRCRPPTSTTAWSRSRTAR